jgi:hypothetical protein
MSFGLSPPKTADFGTALNHKIEGTQSIFLNIFEWSCDVTQNIKRNISSDLRSFYFGSSQFHNERLLIFTPAQRLHQRHTANSRRIQQAEMLFGHTKDIYLDLFLA